MSTVYIIRKSLASGMGKLVISTLKNKTRSIYLILHTHTHVQTNSISIKDLNIRPEVLKLLGKNQQNNSKCKHKDILIMAPTTLKIIRRFDKWNCMKL